jgi:hypothetical protein
MMASTFWLLQPHLLTSLLMHSHTSWLLLLRLLFRGYILSFATLVVWFEGTAGSLSCLIET